MVTRNSQPGPDRRRRSRRVHERSRIALFDVFRQSFEHRDAREGTRLLREKDSTTIDDKDTARSSARRLGVDEETLRAHVHAHLAELMNTVRLDATVDLDNCPNVSRSVVNYGFQDLSNLTFKELTSKDLIRSIKQSLVDHEPRLIESSIKVTVTELEGDAEQRIGVHVTADLIADPADVPVEFKADIDTGSGKVILNTGRI